MSHCHRRCTGPEPGPESLHLTGAAPPTVRADYRHPRWLGDPKQNQPNAGKRMILVDSGDRTSVGLRPRWIAPRACPSHRPPRTDRRTRPDGSGSRGGLRTPNHAPSACRLATLPRRWVSRAHRRGKACAPPACAPPACAPPASQLLRGPARRPPQHHARRGPQSLVRRAAHDRCPSRLPPPSKEPARTRDTTVSSLRPDKRMRATPTGMALIERMSGGVLLSHAVTRAVPSAL